MKRLLILGRRGGSNKGYIVVKFNVEKNVDVGLVSKPIEKKVNASKTLSDFATKIGSEKILKLVDLQKRNIYL